MASHHPSVAGAVVDSVNRPRRIRGGAGLGGGGLGSGLGGGGGGFGGGDGGDRSSFGKSAIGGGGGLCCFAVIIIVVIHHGVGVYCHATMQFLLLIPHQALFLHNGHYFCCRPPSIATTVFLLPLTPIHCLIVGLLLLFLSLSLFLSSLLSLSSSSSSSSSSTSVVASSPPPRSLPSFPLQQQLLSASASCCFVHPSIQPHFHDSLSSVDCNFKGGHHRQVVPPTPPME